MTGYDKLITFPNSTEAALRTSFNAGFDGLNVDPIELVAITEPRAFESVNEILEDAKMHPGALKNFRERHDEEFRIVLPIKEVNTSVRLMPEEGTGNPVAVVPISFLINLGRQILAAEPEMSQSEALKNSSRIAHAYSLGLLAYDEIDPWRLLESPVVDNVSAKLAGSLLCTGINDGTQDLPPRLMNDYMHHTLPKRFAAAIAYRDFETSLISNGMTASGTQTLIDTFIEKRMTSVLNVKQQGTLAVADIDQAFAFPLAFEDLESFILYASFMSKRGLMRGQE